MVCEYRFVLYSYPRWMLRRWGIPCRKSYNNQFKGILAYQWPRCRWQPKLNLSRNLDDDEYIE
jgi:hypothetical protein